MTLEEKINTALKEAMKAKDALTLEGLRAIKSQILLSKTQAGPQELSPSDEIKLLQRLVKQRKESADLFAQQNREDLRQTELSQAAVIEQFLPTQLTSAQIEERLRGIAVELGVNGLKDLGKLINAGSKALEGQAEGKLVAEIAKKILT